MGVEPDASQINASSRILRIAVVSDLHSYSAADSTREEKRRTKPSYLCADPAAPTVTSDPITDLLALVQDPGSPIEADILLCPGDLGDIASAPGILFSWRHLSLVASALNAKKLIATPGNHDLDHSHHEPDGVLKSLMPLFPVPDEGLRNKFWADDFAIIEEEQYRVLCFNSSAHHVGLECEKNYGRLSDRCRKTMAHTLANLGTKNVQILLCHHHPHQHADYELGEEDVMKAGQHLLDMLSKHGDWLVVHGHKHHPKLTHAAGGSRAPWVFAAGSMAVCPFPATPGHARNQFYILEFDPTTFATLGWGGVGRAWDWATEEGWNPAGPSSGLPAEFGFGFLGDLSLLASQITDHLPPRDEGFKRWNDLTALIPKLKRVCPRDIDHLTKYNLNIAIDERGVPFEVARAS